jgi:glyoxylase-like metal-dependent hydrolase (beta-lactamase superfamily II)
MKKVMRRTGFFVFFALIGINALLCQQPQQPPPVTVQQVKGNIYMVKGGSGANTGFVIAEEGVLAIDAKMTEESTKQVVAEIRKLTSKPILTVVITHSDGDHVNGLTGFPRQEIKQIIAHEQTKKDLEEAFKDSKMEALRAYLPTQTFSKDLSVLIPKTCLADLKHFGPAHTSGDAVVFFDGEKVAFIGDLVFIGRDPLIHRQKGGTSFGCIHTLKKLLELNADTYISGHNDPLTKKDIQELLTSMEDKQAKIKSMVQEGKSLDDIKKAFGIADEPGAAAGRRRPSLVEVIYLDLTEKK